MTANFHWCGVCQNQDRVKSIAVTDSQLTKNEILLVHGYISVLYCAGHRNLELKFLSRIKQGIIFACMRLGVICYKYVVLVAFLK